MTLEQWAVTVAASWYIAFAVSSSKGPFSFFESIRLYLPLGGLTSCIICLMPWVAIIIIYLLTGRVLVLEALAASGVALWIHAYSSWVHISK